MMEDVDRERIINNITLLALKTRWNSALEEKMLSYKIFNSRMLQDLMNTDNTQRTTKLFDDVQRRGPRAYKNLIRALHESGNSEAANILEPINNGLGQTPRAYNLSNPSNSVENGVGSSKVWNRPAYERNANNGATLTNVPGYLNNASSNSILDSTKQSLATMNLDSATSLESNSGNPAHSLNLPLQNDITVSDKTDNKGASVTPNIQLPSPTLPKYAQDQSLATTPLKISVKKATKYLGLSRALGIRRCYPMFANPRGNALIINNESFVNDIYKYRSGSTIDANNLDILFEQLGFKVKVQNNRTYQEMREDIATFAQKVEHEDSNMAIIVLLSHGEDGLVFGTDGRKVPNEWILGQFDNENCPKLKGKPKLFIFQACRGDDPDYGAPILIPRLDGGTEVDAQAFYRPRAGSPTSRPMPKIPTVEDMLIAYATIPGYVANRDNMRGTWFIESICKVFMKNAADMDIKEMMDEVSHEMRNYESEFGTKQSCSYEVRHFYKKLFFNPGIYFDQNPFPNYNGSFKKSENDFLNESTLTKNKDASSSGDRPVSNIVRQKYFENQNLEKVTSEDKEKLLKQGFHQVQDMFI